MRPPIFFKGRFVNIRAKPHVYDWAFLALLGFLCAVLTWWQYRNTGKIARAELEQMRGALENRARLLCEAFDREIGGSVALFLPAEGDLKEGGRVAVPADLFQKWKAAGRRPVFSRIAVAVQEGKAEQLYGWDAKSGAAAPLASWPREWGPGLWDGGLMRGPGGGHGFGPMRDDGLPPAGFGLPPFGPMKRGGGRKAFVHPSGRVLQFSGREGGQQSETYLFELDLAYLRDVWLPELVAGYLNRPGEPANEVVVRNAHPAGILCAYPAGADASRPPTVSVPFNRQGRDAMEPGGWTLEVRREPGALEAFVASSRRRNFASSALLNALLLAAGLLLVRHTRSSRRLAEERMHFVAAVSHELYTPLTVIRGAAHNLRRGVVQEPERIDSYAGLIIRHAEQLTEMIEQVLDAARAKRGAAAYALQPVPLADVLDAAIARAEPETAAAHCEVRLQIESPAPVVLGDAAALRRVFQNLLTNAAKHGGEGGWICVSAVRLDLPGTPMVEVAVADGGAGIPRGEQDDIFKPFFRGTAAKTRQVRGSGLGLSLVRDIVEAHGGTVSLTSKAGAGTTFSVRLPAASAQPHGIAHPPS